MATRSAVANTGLNGTNSSVVDAKSLQQFYHSLFRLQDDVFAGKHPRIKLPDDVLGMIAKVKQQATLPITANGTVHLNGKHVTSSMATGSMLPGLGLPPGSAPSQRPISTSSKPPQSSSSSAFDPILLTKSDELVSAEIAMKRQRIEQLLADKVAAQKPPFGSRGKDFAPDYETGLDVDEAYQNAMRVIQHQSVWEDEEKSESFDENDYYSSQAMSWSTEQTDADGAEAAKLSQSFAGAPSNAPSRLLQAAVMQDRAQTAQQIPLPAEYDDLPDEDDEDDYSPPPPDAMPGTTDSDSTPHQQVPVKTNASRPPQAYDSRYEYNRPTQPPANPSAVIHSHIREPFMPQPARVSPLALGKVPPLEQTQIPPTSAMHPPHHQLEPNTSDFPSHETPRDRSPAAPKETMKVSKKRKRKEERAAAREEKRNKRDTARQVVRDRPAASPEPFIKPEPASPPPFASFADMPPPPKRRVIDYPHDDVQVVSPHESRTRAAYREYADYPPPPPGYRYAEPISPQRVRVNSPGPMRRVERDDQDLRRVASLQYARRPYSPSAAYPPLERPPSVMVPQRRAASYAYYDREPVPIVASARDPIYRQPSVAIPPYIRDRSRSPGYDGRASAYPAMRPVDRIDAMERMASPVMMPPPPVPARIVEDKYGNRYYATPAPPDAIPEMRVRESVAPPSRYYDEYPPPQRPLYERPSTRLSMMPPPARPLHDDEMLPPPIPAPQRRREEDPAVEAYRSYRQRESSMRPPDSRGRPLARDDMPPPPPQMPRERPHASDVPEGRRIVSYDDSLASPRQAPVPKDHAALPAYATMPRAYSVRPDAGRPDPYAGDVALQRGREIPRYGTAQPEYGVQMPWERAGGHGGHAGGHGVFPGGMPQFPPVAARDGRWVEVDEGHGGGRRVLPGGEVDEGYGGGKRVVYHM